MSIYMISYDLNTAGKNYNRIIGAIKLLDSSYYHVLKSQWLVSSRTQTASDIREYLQRYIDENDDLLVVKVGDNYSGYIRNSDKLKAWLDARA